MGGDSGEYEVSINSAGVVKKLLPVTDYTVFPVLIRSNQWSYQADNGKSIPIQKDDFTITIDGKKIQFDCVFIAIHGTPGEDGKLQGYFDLLNIPYTSCDLTVSAITFNKYFSNDLALQYGMNVANTIRLTRSLAWTADELLGKVGLPCFVKPNKSGSSVGVTKVYDADGLEPAIRKAFAEDDEVLVQQYIKGREMACGVFRHNGKVTVLPVTEIIPKNDFFDYEAKYTEGKSDEITPASLAPEEEEICRNMTAYLYDKFNCKGVVRFDYFLSDGIWWFLEVNTVPGFSEGSIVPKQVKAAGYSLSEFFSWLIEEALAEAGMRSDTGVH